MFPYLMTTSFLERMDEAAKQLLQLRGPQYNVEGELHKLKSLVRNDADKSSARLCDVFNPWAYKPLLIGVAIMVFSQFCGMNAAIFYSGKNDLIMRNRSGNNSDIVSSAQVEIFNAAESSLDGRISSSIIKAVLV